MDRLNATAEIIRSKGATVFVASIDATNKEKMKQYIQEQDRKYKVTVLHCFYLSWILLLLVWVS